MSAAPGDRRDVLPPAATPLEAALPAARASVAAFLDARPRDARLVVYCHFDADGLAAGALFGRALARLGFVDVRVVASGRSESAFSDTARDRLRALEPDALVVTDLGVSAEGVLAGVPTLYVDHHQPIGWPADPAAVVVSGYGWEPIPCSAWLAWELLAPVALDAGAPIDDLLWLGAVGTISDLGEKAPWAELPGARKRWTAKWLKEAVVLANAARRASAFDVETPLAMLLAADHPRALAEDDAAGAGRLRAYRAEVNAALAEARRAAPTFARDGGPWALVRMHSACQIHPLIAQQWRGRLPGHAVIAANTGFLADAVAFSARTARRDLNLPALLRATGVGDGSGRFGHGHDQASGGHLAPPAFARLLVALGFVGS
ncbi:MAG: DHH family phosphoesterase [Gemmatirosa sp.]